MNEETTPPDDAPRSGLLRRLLPWGIGLALLVLIGAPVGLQLYLSSDHARAAVGAAASQALGRKVEIGTMRPYGLLDGIEVGEVTVGRLTGNPGEGPIASLQFFRARVQLLDSLLAGGPVIQYVKMKGLRLDVIRAPSGAVNAGDVYARAVGNGSEAAPSPGAPDGTATPSFPPPRNIEALDVRIRFRDAALTPPLDVQLEIHQGRIHPRNWEEVEIQLDTVAEESPSGEAHPLPAPVRIGIKVEGEVQPGPRLEAEVTLACEDAAPLRYHLTRARPDASLPLSRLPLKVKLRARYDATPGAPRFEDLSGQADLTGVELALGDGGIRLEGLATLEQEVASLAPDFKLHLGPGATLSAEARAEGILSGQPEVSARLLGPDLDTAALASLVGEEALKGLTLGGPLSLEARLERSAEAMTYRLTVEPGGVEVGHPMLRAPLRLPAGSARLDPERLVVDLPLELGGLRAQLSGEVSPMTTTGKLDVELRASPFGFRELAGVLPEMYQETLQQAPTSGQVEGWLELGGTVGAPEHRFAILPRGLEVRPPGLPAVSVSGEGLRGDTEKVRLDLEVRAAAVTAAVKAELTPASRDGILTAKVLGEDVPLANLLVLAPGLAQHLRSPQGAARLSLFYQGPVTATPAELQERIAARLALPGVGFQVCPPSPEGEPCRPVPVEVKADGIVLKQGSLQLGTISLDTPHGALRIEGEAPDLAKDRRLDLRLALTDLAPMALAGKATDSLSVRLKGPVGLSVKQLPPPATPPAPASPSPFSRQPPPHPLQGLEATLHLEGLAATVTTTRSSIPLNVKAQPVELLAGVLRFPAVKLLGPGLQLGAQGQVQLEASQGALKSWALVDADKLPGGLLPEGMTASGGVKVVIQHDGPLAALKDASAEVTAQGLKVRPPGSPAELAWTSGSIQASSRAVTGKDLALSLGAGLDLSASLALEAMETLSLSVRAGALDLGALLGLAPTLPEALSARGKLGLTADYRGPLPTDAARFVAGLTAEVTPKQAVVSYLMPTGPLDFAVKGGKASMQNGTLSLQALGLEAEGGTAILSGTAQPMADQDRLSLRLEAGGIGVRFGPLVEPLRLKTGALLITENSIEFDKPSLHLGAGTRLRLVGRIEDLAGEKRLEGLRATGSIELADIQPAVGLDPSRTYRGPVTLNATMAGTAADFAVAGSLKAARTDIYIEYHGEKGGDPFRIPITDLDAPFTFQGTRFEVPTITGSLYGGAFTAHLAFDLSESPMRYTMGWTVDGTDLALFTRRSLQLPGGLGGRIYMAGEGSGVGTDAGLLKLNGPGRVEDLVLEGRKLGDHFGISELVLGQSAAPPPDSSGGLKNLLKGAFERAVTKAVSNLALDLVEKHFFKGARKYLEGMLEDHRYPLLDFQFHARDGWMGLERFGVRDQEGVFEGKALFELETLALDGKLTRAAFEVAEGRKIYVTDLPVRGLLTSPTIDTKTFFQHVKISEPPRPDPVPTSIDPPAREEMPEAPQGETPAPVRMTIPAPVQLRR